MLNNNEQIVKMIKENSESIKAHAIESIGIFGLFARNESTNKSDVDIMVTFQAGKKTFRNFMGLKILLQDLLQREVDLVASDNIRNELKPYVMKEIIYVKGF